MTAFGPLLGTGKEAEVFACGDGRVLKLYRPGVSKLSAFREAATVARVEALGLPAPKVFGVEERNGRWGVIMTRVEGESFAQAMQRDQAAVAHYFNALAAVQGAIHAVSGQGFEPLKERLERNIRRAGQLSPALRDRLLRSLGEMRDGDRLCHGDFHPFNVLGPPHAPVVVDWLDAGCGAPAADICRSYVLLQPMRPEIAEGMLRAALERSGITRDEVMAWMPVTAAARLAEGVPEVEALLAMAEAV